MAGACRRILKAQDNSTDLDVRSLDIGQCISVFNNLNGRELKPSSLKDYEQRFRRAVSAYVSYLNEPTTWKYPSRVLGHRSRKSTSANANNGDTDQSTENHDNIRVDDPHEYRYPFRANFMAKLVIPRDATTAEINRLIGWARTLAADYEPEP